jgi:hypothetical protein
MVKIHTKSLLGTAFCVAAVTGAGSTAVFADHGEPHGQTERGNGMSICTFSGLNDEPHDPHEGGQVQSFGQIVKVVGVAELKAEGATPAALCNPNNAPWGKNTWWRK